MHQCAALRSWKASKLCRNALPSTAPLARRSRLLVKDGGMAAERLLDRGGVELPENVSDGRIGWRPTPFQPEELAQTNEMDVDEAMDTPVRVGSGYHRQNSEQNHVGQTIQLAFGPSGVLDLVIIMSIGADRDTAATCGAAFHEMDEVAKEYRIVHFQSCHCTLVAGIIYSLGPGMGAELQDMFHSLNSPQTSIVGSLQTRISVK
jgi:hypothetical protein